MSMLTTRRGPQAPLARLTPWADFEAFQDRIDRLMGRLPTLPSAESGLTWTPAIDVQEKEKEYLLTAELPGMTEKDVTVHVEQNTLTIKGEKKTEREETKEKDGRWHLIERSWGSFERSFTLPGSVDGGKVKAGFKNGLLTIHLPKREPSNGRRVPINRGGDDEC
jgi:HSP20 family protein